MQLSVKMRDQRARPRAAGGRNATRSALCVPIQLKRKNARLHSTHIAFFRCALLTVRAPRVYRNADCLRHRHVRFGSEGDMSGLRRHVRFAPESGHRGWPLARLLRHNRTHACSTILGCYSVTNLEIDQGRIPPSGPHGVKVTLLSPGSGGTMQRGFCFSRSG
jgi:hypothetical protein